MPGYDKHAFKTRHLEFFKTRHLEFTRIESWLEIKRGLLQANHVFEVLRYLGCDDMLLATFVMTPRLCSCCARRGGFSSR